jgi:hypothetical protein
VMIGVLRMSHIAHSASKRHANGKRASPAYKLRAPLEHPCS